MNKKITIVLSGPWVLSHRGDDVLPIQFLVSLIKEKYGDKLNVEKANLTEIHITVKTEADAESLSNELRSAFVTRYELGEGNNVLSLTVEDTAAPEKEEKDSSKEEGKDDDGAVVKKTEDKSELDEDLDEGAIKKDDNSGDGQDDDDEDDEEETESPSPLSRRPSFGRRLRRDEEEEKPVDPPETCIQRIDALIGADEFKALAREIVSIAPQIKKNSTYDVFASRGFVFSVNNGYGLTTYLKQLATLLKSLGLRKGMDLENIAEVSLPAPKADNSDAFNDVYRVMRYGSSDETHIVCIDISEWMNALNTVAFRGFLNTLVSHMNEFVVVFRVPFVDKDVLERVRFALGDVMFVRLVSFPPFNHAEMRRYADGEIRKYGFHMSRTAWNDFDRRITEEKSDGRFYGLHTVTKVVKELLYNKHLDNARRGKNDLCITKRDTAALCAEQTVEGMTAAQMLEGLVGNETIKARIFEIVSQIVFARKQEGMEAPCIHMRFVGNPGTGKTTVARIIGKLLKEQGVLRIGDFHEHAGRDLCGRYIGETAPKTTSICRDAYGSVLFIDEAYTLYRGVDNDRDYGREALDTLIAEMENHRDDMVIIMAGYADEMELLMHGNAGLASRMPYVIEFPNFTRDQLYDIFMSMMSKQFKHDEALPAAVKAYFDGLPDSLLNSKEFSNARFVRNLFERTWAKATMRCQLSKISEITLTKDDFDRSIQDREFTFIMEKKKNRIGFYE